MTTDDQLCGILGPGEHTLWSASRPSRRPGIGGLVGYTALLVVLAAVLGAVLVVLWNGGTGGASTAGPFRDFGDRWPIAAGVVLVLLLLTLGRRLYRGVPAQLQAVTNHRALVAEPGRDGARILDEQPRESLTHLTRVQEGGRTDLLWRVRVTRSSSDSGASRKNYHRHGLQWLTEADPAEAALLDPQRLAEAPDPGIQLGNVPPEERRLLADVLLPGERVAWCEEARTSEVQRRMGLIIFAGFGVLLLVGFFSFAFVGSSRFFSGGIPLPVLVMGGVFAVFIGWMIVGLYRELRARSMDDAAYAVTGLRALTAMRGDDGTLVVNSFLPTAVAGNERPSPGREGADFVFGEKAPLPLRFLIEQDGFHRVRDADGASAALHRLTRAR